MCDPIHPLDAPTRRSARLSAEVRNPLLRLPAAQRLSSLPPEVRQILADLLHELACDARDRAEQSWRRHKAPMAAYWKAVSVYAGHLHRMLRSAGPRRRG